MTTYSSLNSSEIVLIFLLKFGQISSKMIWILWLKWVLCFFMVIFSFSLFVYMKLITFVFFSLHSIIQSITNYLRGNGGDFILKEQEKLHCLKPKTKNKLMEKLVNYIFEQYSMYPNSDDIILVSRATVEIFDKLKDDKGGVVSLVQLILLKITDWLTNSFLSDCYRNYCFQTIRLPKSSRVFCTTQLHTVAVRIVVHGKA